MTSPNLPQSVSRFVARHGANVLEGLLEACDELLASHPADQVRRALGATALFPKMPPHSAFCLAAAMRAVENGMAMTMTYRFAGAELGRDGIEVWTELKRDHPDLAKRLKDDPELAKRRKDM